MIPYERREQIIEHLTLHKTATVAELARSLYISEASVRRDLSALEQEGLIRRTWGGVVLNENQNGVVPLSVRDSEHTAAKEALAKSAAELVKNGDTIMMDASSTVRRMMRYLSDRRDLTVITNNLRILQECTAPGIRLYATGGAYSRENHALMGPAAEAMLRGVSADACFFSSQGITEEGEITDASEAETSLRRVMLERAKRQYFLCDASKIGQRRLFTLCRKEDITAVLASSPLPWES